MREKRKIKSTLKLCFHNFREMTNPFKKVKLQSNQELVSVKKKIYNKLLVSFRHCVQ